MNCEAAAIIIRGMNIERQRSGHACGLYTIAAAVDLCSGNDPCSSLYDEGSMRNNLELCFRKRAIAPFPQQFRDTSQRVLKEISVPVYCICRYPDSQHALVIWYAVIHVINGSTSIASAFRTLKLVRNQSGFVLGVLSNRFLLLFCYVLELTLYTVKFR